jgi:hypothetical protein
MCCLGSVWPEGCPFHQKHPRVLRANRFCIAFTFSREIPHSRPEKLQPQIHLPPFAFASQLAPKSFQRNGKELQKGPVLVRAGTGRGAFQVGKKHH